MKRKAFSVPLLALVASIGILLASCHDTPTAPAVVPKEEVFLETSYAAEEIYEMPEFPETYTASFSKNDVDMYFDAAVFVPAEPMKIDSVAPRQISEEQAQKIVDVLIGDSELLLRGEITADMIIDEITLLKTLISESEDEFPEIVASRENKVRELEALLAEGGIPQSASVVEREFVRGMESKVEWDEAAEAWRETEVPADYEILGGVFRLSPGQEGDIGILNRDDGFGSSVTFSRGLFPLDYDSDANHITREEAIEIAENFVSEIGEAEHLSLLECIELEPLHYFDRGGDNEYVLIYTPNVSGVYANYAMIREYPEEAHDRIWPQEGLILQINYLGIWMVEWVEPSELGEVLVNQVKLKDFDEIMEIFQRQAIYSSFILGTENVTHFEYHVEKIRLGLMKVRLSDGKGYAYVPVWDFYGYTNHSYAEESGMLLDENGKMRIRLFEESFLTINAVDGTIIDRLLGY